MAIQSLLEVRGFIFLQKFSFFCNFDPISRPLGGQLGFPSTLIGVLTSRSGHRQHLWSTSGDSKLAWGQRIDFPPKIVIFLQFWTHFQASWRPVRFPLLMALGPNLKVMMSALFVINQRQFKACWRLENWFSPKNLHFSAILTQFPGLQVAS